MSLQASESRFSKIQMGILLTHTFSERFSGANSGMKNPGKRLQNYLQILLLMINFTAATDNIIPFQGHALTKLNLFNFFRYEQ